MGKPRWNTKDGSKPRTLEGDVNVYQEYEVLISEIYKGEFKIGDKIVVRSYGGKANDFYFENDTPNKFETGKDVVLCLYKARNLKAYDSKNGYYLVEPFGVYNVKNEKVTSEFFDENGKNLSNSSESRGNEAGQDLELFKKKIEEYNANPIKEEPVKSDL